MSRRCYRIVKRVGQEVYQLGELHYDRAGQLVGATIPLFESDKPEDVIREVSMALQQATKHPPFEEPSEWRAQA